MRQPTTRGHRQRDMYSAGDASARREARKLHACEACGWKQPAVIKTKRVLETHHVLPTACGGATETENLAVLCPNCHALAHALWPARKPWKGPWRRDQLIGALKGLLRNPELWFARYQNGMGFDVLTDADPDGVTSN